MSTIDPNGSPEKQKQINIGFAAVAGEVVIQFSEPTTWVRLPTQDAIAMANGILQAAIESMQKRIVRP